MANVTEVCRACHELFIWERCGHRHYCCDICAEKGRQIWKQKARLRNSLIAKKKADMKTSTYYTLLIERAKVDPTIKRKLGDYVENINLYIYED